MSSEPSTDRQEQRDRPRKVQRISQACDLCHRRSIRCRPSNEDGDRCQNCYDFDVSCTFERPSKRRKHPHAPIASQQPSQSTSTGNSGSSRDNQHHGPSTEPASAIGSAMPITEHHVQTTALSSVDLVSRSRDDIPPAGNLSALLNNRQDPSDDVTVAWKAFVLACEPAILELLDVYMDVVYPLYPLFHEATLRRRVQARDHLQDRGFFASVMGACALASARVQDGANTRRSTEAVRQPQVSTEIFYAAAKDALSKDMTQNEGIEFLRACTLLALTSIQWGHIGSMQQYMGQFYTLAAMQRFYDEKYWDRGLSNSELELRRRVYWCTYTLDVYGAAIWNCFLRSQEVHANVTYPADYEDERDVQQDYPYTSWIVGWNFATDLYRVLEHTLNKARAKRFQSENRRQVDSLVFQDDFSETKVMNTILQLYYELPGVFKETPPMTGNMRKDIYAYQAANIQATLQLLRMILFSVDGTASTDGKSDVATEVLTVFHTIPRELLRAISTPLIYHLGSIGQVLASVIDEPLTEERYRRVRGSLLSLAELLSSLEEGLVRMAGVSNNLRSQVDKLDRLMLANVKPPEDSFTLASAVPQNASHSMYNSGLANTNNQHPGQSGAGVGVDPAGASLASGTGTGMASDFQLPPELFGNWTWPEDIGLPTPYYPGTY